MISAEAPILFAKACEMFIIEMTHKAYYYASKNGRKTLQRNDIAAAITDAETYDFLLDIMPRDEMINSNKEKQLVRLPLFVSFLKVELVSTSALG
jgi:nuclear transcription factor Y, gamma